MQTEDRIKLQSFTIKIDGEQYRQLMQLHKEEVSKAQFLDLPPEDYPKLTDILAAAIYEGLRRMSL